MDHPKAVVSYGSGGAETVYVGGGGSGSNVAVFKRNPTSDQLDLIQSLTNGFDGIGGIDAVQALAVSPDGKHVYAASTSDHLVVFKRNAGNGMLTFVEAIENGQAGFEGLGGADAVAVTPDGRSVYVAGRLSHSLARFQSSTTSDYLEQLDVVLDSDSGVGGLDNPRGLAVNPGGDRMYVANDASDGSLAVFALTVPEPQSLLMHAAALGSLLALVRRRAAAI